MAAKTWEADYRFPAIQASIRLIGNHQQDDLSKSTESFCLPVADRPLVGWTPGYFMLIALVLGFLLLGLGAVLISVAERLPPGPFNITIIVAAVCSSLSGMAMFFIPLKCDRQIVRWLIGERGQKLVERARMAQIMTAEVSNADQSDIKISVSGDDFALIFLDELNRQIVMEGLGARYQIRAEDVVRLVPFQFMSYLGVEVVYRIAGEVQLRLAVARTSLLLEFTRQVPILFFLRNKISNKLLNRFVETLGPIEIPAHIDQLTA